MDLHFSSSKHFVLQVPSITTTNLGYLPDLRIFLLRGQGQCVIEEAQDFLVRILNCTQRSMDLSLTFDPSFSQREHFLWIGLTNRQLGKLEAHQTFDVHLQLVPLSCGIKVNEEIEQTNDRKKTSCF